MNEKVKKALEQIKGILNEELTFKEDVKELINPIETALNDFDRYHESQQYLIKGKDEYIAKLCNDRAELKEEIKRLDSQYKNIHNTKVKVPLCNILNGLSQNERHRVIEDIYYSQAERQDFYENKIAKLEKENKEQENELKELKEFVKIVYEKSVDMLILRQANKNIDYEASVFMPYTLNRQLTQAEFDLVKKVVEKYGN